MTEKVKKSLYLGLEIPHHLKDKHVLHYPIIKIVPCPVDTKEIQITFRHIPSYTHFIFTSRSAVNLFFQYMQSFDFTLEHLRDKKFIAVGQGTANEIKQHGIEEVLVPELETAEGIIRELRCLSLQQAHLFWPHSALSRPLLTDFFETHSIRYTECILYETHSYRPSIPTPDLKEIDEIIFTSPSTVNAFVELFGEIPREKQLTSIGPITQSHLKKSLKPNKS